MRFVTAGLVVADEVLLQELRAALRDAPVRILFDDATAVRVPALRERLERLCPDVLFFDLNLRQDSLQELVRRLKALPLPPTIVVVDRAPEAQTILEAMRSGANEFLCPPLHQVVKAALERISSARAQQQNASDRTGKLMGFLSAKGGCGATTIACHVAVELERQTSHQVLLADFDVTAGLIGFLLNAKTQYSILDALSNTDRLDLSFWRGLTHNTSPRLDVIPAPALPVRNVVMPPERVRLVADFLRSNYDWIVADLGRGLNGISLTLLDELDELYLVATVDVLALHQAVQIVRSLRDSGISPGRLKLLLNGVPSGAVLSAEDVERLLGLSACAVLPPADSDLRDAYSEGKLVGRDTALGKQLARLATSMAGLQAPAGKPHASSFSLRKVIPRWGDT